MKAVQNNSHFTQRNSAHRHACHKLPAAAAAFGTPTIFDWRWGRRQKFRNSTAAESAWARRRGPELPRCATLETSRATAMGYKSLIS